MADFPRMRRLAWALVLVLSGCATSSRTSDAPGPPHVSHHLFTGPGVLVPTSYEEDRFIAHPVLAETGEALNIYLDTGGNNVLFSDVVDHQGLERVTLGAGKQRRTEVLFPPLAPAGTMPLPHTREGRVLVFDRRPINEGWSGILGPEWFGGRCWLFDYPRQRLVLLNQCEATPASPHEVALGFAKDLSFPRIQVVVDGQTLDLLFDSGANAGLSDAALAAVADGRAAQRATSFITRTLFERWRNKHPTWRVIEEAESRTGEPMIEVAEVTIAGYTVGPVWFTRRTDNSFHTFMSQWMDRQIEGALGGNALRHFRIVVDYPHARAIFEKP